MKKILDRLHPEARQIALFLIVGGLSTALNYSVFWALLDLFGVNYVLSSWTGYFAGVFFGYYLNARYTFGMRTPLGGKHPVLYTAVYLASLGLSTGTLVLLVEVLGIPPKAANLIVIGQTTVTNYLGCKYLVFRRSKS